MVFDWSLELGAGDGYQSAFLVRHTRHLICSEYYINRLAKSDFSNIHNLICDAECSSHLFKRQSFSCIYSSNLLEHVPNPQKVLNGCAHLLKADGICIHIMPGVFWKICHLFLYMPVWALVHLETLSKKGGYKVLLWEFKKFLKACIQPKGAAHSGMEPANNPKSVEKKRPLFLNFFIPHPHGVSATNFRELFDFRKQRWKKEFETSDLELIAIRKGPVTSGYGLGLHKIRYFLEKMGLASEYAYISQKKGADSIFKRFF